MQYASESTSTFPFLHSTVKFWNVADTSIFPFLLSAVMGVLAYAVNYIALPSIIILVVQIVVCIIAYFGLAKLFKVECLQYIIDTLKEMRSLKNGKQS